jgi:hypothetical protein
MTIIFAKHEPYDDGHLGRVAFDMDVMGPPTIKAIRFGNELYALEGSHRLALAHHHKIIPKVIILEPDIAGCDDFFERIRDTLPKYEFEYLLILEEKLFNIKE